MVYFQNDKNIKCNFGKIINIDENNNIKHTCKIELDSIGSPIIDYDYDYYGVVGIIEGNENNKIKI